MQLPFSCTLSHTPTPATCFKGWRSGRVGEDAQRKSPDWTQRSRGSSSPRVDCWTTLGRHLFNDSLLLCRSAISLLLTYSLCSLFLSSTSVREKSRGPREQRDARTSNDLVYHGMRATNSLGLLVRPPSPVYSDHLDELLLF